MPSPGGEFRKMGDSDLEGIDGVDVVGVISGGVGIFDFVNSDGNPLNIDV